MPTTQDFIQSSDHLELIQLRLNRLTRLVELKAPEVILNHEYSWFNLEVERLHRALQHRDVSYTEEQLVEIRQHMELERMSDED